MLLIDAQLTAGEVLQAFHQDEPFLFLGSAFLTVAIVSFAFCALRKRFDALLVWTAIFAGLYGLRIWMQAHVLRIDFEGNFAYERLCIAISYLIPIPALMFFRAAGFLGRGPKLTRAGQAINSLFLLLFLCVLAFGPLRIFDLVNGAMVIVVLLILLARSVGKNANKDHDFSVARIGIFCFVGLALWDNIVGELWMPSRAEPYGFAVLLGCLGYIGARRTLERDSKLAEIQSELELARRIQQSILPGDFPASTNFCVAARYVPMTAVAGDLYDFIVINHRQAGLFIADVSGHGMPAALIASMVKMAAISQRNLAAHPAQLLAGINIALTGNTQGQYVTAAYVYLDADKRELRYAAAGHPPMLLLREGIVTEIVENGLLLAASDAAEYSERALPLKNGDRLLLYTDGLVEARNLESKMFGEESLIAVLRETGGVSPADAADRLIASIKNWAKSQDDDLTVLVCDYTAAG
jgi:sigma-B regulation protein RsbU (phosphoserine phosphatase)